MQLRPTRNKDKGTHAGPPVGGSPERPEVPRSAYECGGGGCGHMQVCSRGSYTHIHSPIMEHLFHSRAKVSTGKALHPAFPLHYILASNELKPVEASGQFLFLDKWLGK